MSITALFLAYLLRFNLNFSLIELEHFFVSANILLIINTAVFIGLQTYTRVLRFASNEDYFRMVLALVLSALFMFVANGFKKFNSTIVVTPASVIIIYVFITSAFLVGYRVLVRSLFLFIKSNKVDKQNVIIFGAGESGIITKRAIDHDGLSSMKVVGFLDDDTRKVGKIIDGIKVYNTQEDLKKIIKNEAAKCLIFSIQTITPARKDQMVEFCLENNIKILDVPPINQWVNGELRPSQLRDVKIEDLLERETISIDNEGIVREFKNKRVLITGAAGSIGSEIVRQIIKYNPQCVILCDQSESSLHELELELNELKNTCPVHIFIADVKNQCRIEYMMKTYNPHIIFHAAAYKHVPMMERHPTEAVLTNVMGTKNLADMAVKYQVQKFVMISTDKAVNPTNVMGATKRVAEIYTQALNNHKSTNIHTKFITTRFGNVLGSNGSVIPRFKKQIENGGPVTVTHPEITRFFMTIPEACRLVLEAGAMGHGGEIYIFDMGRSVKITDLARKMIKLSGFTPDIDIKIEYTGLRPGEKLYEELLAKTENTTPTHNQKIMIAKVAEYDYTSVSQKITEIIYLSSNQNTLATVSEIKSLIPEFISNNSEFEKLDVLRQ